MVLLTLLTMEDPAQQVKVTMAEMLVILLNHPGEVQEEEALEQ